ncbi:protein translocase subunit SecD [Altererythrobacter sp. KTW20L]|uniref:protein translocase subunit SecD n=1 Tax=Altererythrobacter sp. KTW20L TaxID=2942210 RepID=UPI0020BD54F7|nr:protein translocase subunit SecD [Altererythrobacter sp. KTW20L]MCL6249468.1 protein translocase subunit SecD [Altererythrobacter sp. KTW20L]
MLDFPLWKRNFLWAITIFTVALALPSLASLTNLRWPDMLPSQTVNLGLDLAGGSHILLEADSSQVGAQRLENMEEAVRSALDNAREDIGFGDVSTAGGRLTIRLDDPSQVDAAREAILPLMGTGLVSEWDLEFLDGNTRLVLTPTQSGIDNAVTTAMDSATDVVRRRIDSLGTREPTIIRQGDTRIVVQVPGLTDPDELKDLLGQTARLEFKMLDTQATPAQIESGIPRAGSELVPGAPGGDYAGQVIAVRRLGGVRGDSLVDASQTFNPDDNTPAVSITFDSVGAERFARLTTENVGQQFAIILDGEVLSAPRILQPIYGGSSQITGGFSLQQATSLARALASGALPVDLTVIEERTVGPDLGAASIRSGTMAMGVGTLLVIVLMILVYGRFGIYATAALAINVLMILGIMAAFSTTLTLPGIAGFVLTIGAAVDANVLINERIREERKRGRRVVAAVENGYREASRAIYDANATNFIAGVLLFTFGSGPVRGFAVVLLIGLFTSVFTAVTMTRMWTANWLRAKRPTDIQI